MKNTRIATYLAFTCVAALAQVQTQTRVITSVASALNSSDSVFSPGEEIVI